jgi:hypothetical protein
LILALLSFKEKMKRPRGGGQRKGEERGQVEEKSKGKKKKTKTKI